MSKKPLIIVDSDAEMKALKEELDKGYQMFNDATEFLKKQAEQSYKELVGSRWEQIEAVLQSRNLLPEDYEYGSQIGKEKEPKYSLGFNDGVLYLKNKADEGNDLAKSLMEMLFKK